MPRQVVNGYTAGVVAALVWCGTLSIPAQMEPSSEPRRVTLLLFDLVALDCDQRPCDGFVVGRIEAKVIKNPARFALIRVRLAVPERQLALRGLEPAPLLSILVKRDPSCDRALRDFPRVHGHTHNVDGTTEGTDLSPFSCISETTCGVMVPDDQVLECYTFQGFVPS